MNIFFKRLGESLIKLLSLIIGLVFTVLIIGIVGIIIFLLPSWLLSFIFGGSAYWWIVFIMILLPLSTEWKNIRNWFKWQFIEPFKK